MISQYLTSAYEIPFEPLSSGAVVRVYDEAGKVIETHEHAGDFKEW